MAIEATIDLRTLASQYTALLEDIDYNISVGYISIADIAAVRTVLGNLDDMVIDALTTAVAEKMDKEEAM